MASEDTKNMVIATLEAVRKVRRWLRSKFRRINRHIFIIFIDLFYPFCGGL
jgi:hypothetical protein